MAMKTNYTRVGFTDKGWNAMLRRMVASDPQVVVGVMEPVASQQHHEDDDVTVGEVANFAEFGFRHRGAEVPPRPFLRTALVWGSELAIKKIMAKVARDVVLGTSKNVAIRAAGRWAVRRVVSTMKERVFVPNKQATVDKKGNDWTLRDSRKLISSIGFEVVTGLRAIAARFSE